ncbi:HAD-IC family P-type ATPase [Candidatus Uhrbacteria bacterium]|nr:HAD-IC family P-type ATPase [Candidatus Uhrbacteria bacterium]
MRIAMIEKKDSETPLWHTRSVAETYATLGSTSHGLSAIEVALRVQRYGENVLPSRKSDPWWKVFARQFMSPMMVVLLVAAGISLALADVVDAGVIAAAVVINSVIGFIQEYKANKALEELRSLVQPMSVVLREGKEVSVSAVEIVPGDILVLHLGDRVTADARILESVDLLVNESALTGESLPVHKAETVLESQVSLAERTNMMYTGTSVVGGRGKAVVVATALETELGRIARLVQETQETRTPLQVQLGRLARWLSVLVLGLVVVLFMAGLVSGRTVVEMFEMSVALSVAAIPEGLIVSVTIILAIGMQRILYRKSLMRRLVAVETLGSVSIICSDKTGTITQGEMRVTHLVTPKQTWTYPFPVGEEPQTAMRTMFKIMALCNDAVMVEGDPDPLRGSPTERALLGAVLEQHLDVKTLSFHLPRVWEIPFNSAYKYMVTAHASGKKTDVFLKGAPDVVLPFCTKIKIDGKEGAVAPSRRAELNLQMLSLSRKGIRLMALATRSVDPAATPLTRQTLGDFTFLGFVGLRDPLRPQAREQIEAARAAGIRTIMVTGDHPETARAIGAEAGLVAEPESVVGGSELDGWSDEELTRRVPRISIYARVEPRHKIRIVNAWQQRGEVVAMTGDGVNDAPALKAADIGIAVGSGTEVAKQASDMVILNNDLGTITAAIEEGRVIFDNIRKTTVYLLADSFTEMILIGGSILLGLPIPLLPAQILWINLVADSFPNVGLTLEPAEKDVMKLPPRPRDEPVLNREMLLIIFVIGAVTDLLLFALYWWLLGTIGNIEDIRSIMFAAVGIDSLLYIFAVKSFRQTIFRMNPFSNLWLVVGVAIGFGLMLLALLHPFFQTIFEITPLALPDWGLLLMIGVIKLVAIELTKEFFLLRNKKKMLTPIP